MILWVFAKRRRPEAGRVKAGAERASCAAGRLDATEHGGTPSQNAGDILVLILSILLLQSAASSSADKVYCQAAKKIAASLTAEAPVMVDAATRMDGMSVICSLRSTSWNKTILADEDAMREGWQARKQSQWDAIVCSDPQEGPMALKGWRFVQNLTFRSGERFTIEAHCPHPQ